MGADALVRFTDSLNAPAAAGLHAGATDHLSTPLTLLTLLKANTAAGVWRGRMGKGEGGLVVRGREPLLQSVSHVFISPALHGSS